jgi:zinc and cadmium transporter
MGGLFFGSAMSPSQLLALYSVLILLASLAGGWIPLFVRLTHTRLQLATSFVAGLMLGVGILHLLPHAWREFGNIDLVAGWALGGFLVMFFIQRFFHFHHHDVPEESPEKASQRVSHDEHGCDGRHDGHRHGETLAEKSAHHLSWAAAAAGLAMHTLIDGIALAASVEAETRARGIDLVAGIGAFLVIILHKPFDAMTIGTLMASGGWSRTARHLVNALFALVIPCGILLFHFGAARYASEGGAFLGGALAFAAGSFLCIAASDLLPELQFHAHDRFKLSVALVAGVALSVLVGRFEPHGHEHPDGGQGLTLPH